MYGYTAEFFHEGQILMLLHREPALRSHDMDIHSLKMLQRNRIPHILHVDMQELDFDVTLQYEISGKRMLQQLIRSEQLSEQQYYEWMLQLLKLLIDCREYMLSPNHLLLHEQFMFVQGGVQQGQLFVPYIPTHDPLHAKAALEGLRRLAVQLSGIVQHWSSDGFQQLIRKLHDDSQSIEQIQHFVQSMMAYQPIVQPDLHRADFHPRESSSHRAEYSMRLRQEEMNQELTYADRQSSGSMEQRERIRLPFGITEQPSVQADDMNIERNIRNSTSHEVDWGFDEEEDSEGEQPTQSLTISLGVSLFIAALGWKFGYFTSSNATGLILSIGATVIGAIVGYGWWKGWFHSMLRLPTVESQRRRQAKKDSGDPLLPDFASIELTSQLKRTREKRKSKPSRPIRDIQSDSNHALSTMNSDVEQRTAHDKFTPRQAAHGASSFPNVHSHPYQQVRSSPLESASSYEERNTEHGWHERRGGRDQGSDEDYNSSSMERHYAMLSAHTSILSGGPQDATALLLPSNTADGGQDLPLGQLRIEKLARDGSTLSEERIAGEWPYVLGRSNQGVHYVLAEAGISKLHCELEKDEAGCYTVQDLGSKNGTELNGELLVPYKKYALDDRARLKLGNTILIIHHL